jgi:hypothetical protein
MDAGEKAKRAQQILSDVFYHMQAWRVAVNTETRVTTPVCKPKWRPPPEEAYKIIGDAVHAHTNLDGVSS